MNAADRCAPFAGLLVKVPLPAVELLKKNTLPPIAPLTAPPLLVKVPLPAVEVSKNSVWPPNAPLTAPPLLVKVPLPAVEVLKNSAAAGCAADRAAVVGESSQAPRRRAVSECYRSKVAGSINSSHKVLCDS